MTSTASWRLGVPISACSLAATCMIPTGRGTPRTSRAGTCRGRTSTSRSRASRRDAPDVAAAPAIRAVTFEKGREMKITGIETFVVSNGFTPPRPWHFCAIRTDAGLTGYSEFGSDGITHGLVGLVKDLGQRLVGKDPTAVEKHYLDLYRAVRQAPYGPTQQAIAGIELALWDLAGKA